MLINLYNPNNEEQQVSVIANLLQAIELIDSNHGYEVILGGDFNFIFDIKTGSDGGGKPKLMLSSIAGYQVQRFSWYLATKASEKKTVHFSSS